MIRIKKSELSWKEVYKLILENILSQNLKPGEVVTEQSISDKFGIGRTPTREALKKLEYEGIIVTQNRTKKIYNLTLKDINEIFDIKISLEGYIAKRAAELSTNGQLKELEKVINNMREIASRSVASEKDEDKKLKDWHNEDNNFHGILFKIADNTRSQEIIKTLNIQWHNIRVGLGTIEGRIAKSTSEHEEIAKAIFNKQSEKAQQLMRDHLENLRKELVKMMKIFNYPE